ncbi:MAG: ABC transporter ATP-binding protein [Sphaerochaetaceae bacterium]|nr:ABC transporter ATP-binding protein [Sphaerochaetaceae bacterium]MDC7237586.1 ABC transporter ATP-binding protein [Sphaerochaetaceae bacterium]
MEKPFFELKDISKYFAKVIANKDVSFSVNRGEVLALLGENGAGKSTCMKILYGLYRADKGEIFKDGVPIIIKSPKDAMRYKVSMIQQHFSLVSAHTVTENIILGNVKGKINWEEESNRIQHLADKYGFSVDAKKKIKDLTVGEQQKVEILKALYLDANLLIMDEPTAVLTPQEIDNLMNFVKDYSKQGNAVIFITHKLKEVMSVANRIIVMRNGMVYGNVNKEDTDEIRLSKLMIENSIEELEKPKVDELKKEVCVSLKNICVKEDQEIPLLNNISFDIHKGEIFGVAGVSGNGQQELCMALCGAQKINSGSIYLNNKDISNLSIKDRIGLGMAYVPSDRHRYGLVMSMSLAENILLKTSYSKQWSKNGLIDKKKLKDTTNGILKDFRVKASGPFAIAKELSGGNQQKVIVGREVENCGDFIIFDQPTRGLDLGAINNVHSAILSEKEKGKAILLVSTELSEIFTLCDRVAVFYKGEIQGIYNTSDLNSEKIGLLMAGYKNEGESING